MTRPDLTAVIPAAGAGTRLRPHTDALPKALLPVGGRPLLDRALDVLDACGVGRVVVVTGYRHAQIEARVAARGDARVGALHNPRWATSNNACSLALAAPRVDAGLLIVDGDLLFDAEALARVLAAPGEIVIAVEPRPRLGAEEIKVELDARGAIVAISKEVPPLAAAGEAVGIARFAPAAARALFARLEAQLARGLAGLFYERAFEEMIEAGWTFAPCDVGGLGCLEIDTPDDLERAQRIAP